MPGMDGIELSEKLKNDYPDIKVIVFTMYMENWFVEQLTKNGARGFVSKNSRISELVEAVRQVSKGNYFYCHQFKSKFGLNGTSDYDSQINMLDSLTSKEMQIVEYFANNLKRKEIAAKLSVHQSTIDTYLANILLKLNAGDEEEIIRIAKKQKFVSDVE
jgi:DNA-binding NarL/FixJ family response regulator